MGQVTKSALETGDLQPTLTGDLLALRPLRSEDWEDLFLAASDPLIWEQHPANDRYKREVFKHFFQGGLDSGGAFVAIDRKTRQIVGSSRYLEHHPVKREVEIGWTFLARSHWGGLYNAEMKRLMLTHAFQFVDTVLFQVGPENRRSRKAIEKVGGVLTTREGRPDHVVYEITKPALGRRPLREGFSSPTP